MKHSLPTWPEEFGYNLDYIWMVFGTAWYFYVFSEDAQLQDRSRYSIALFTPGALACLVSLRCCPEGVDDWWFGLNTVVYVDENLFKWVPSFFGEPCFGSLPRSNPFELSESLYHQRGNFEAKPWTFSPRCFKSFLVPPS